jgi:hypothetical protein
MDVLLGESISPLRMESQQVASLSDGFLGAGLEAGFIHR